MGKDRFEKDMRRLIQVLPSFITEKNSRDSILKGFVDSNGNLYSITLDTKVLSKVVEFVLLPKIKKFCDENNYQLKEPLHQNHYPDLTIIDNETGMKYAIDIKTTYRKMDVEFKYNTKSYILKRTKNKVKLYEIDINGNFDESSEVENDDKNLEDEITLNGREIKEYSIIYGAEQELQGLDKKVQEKFKKTNEEVNGMTLGAFTGYFRDRTSNKNILYPYSSYDGHYVMGIIYSREQKDGLNVHRIEEYSTLESPIYDIDAFFIEKYKIATDKPGSGNTKNIGSIKNISGLKEGNGPFQNLEEFDEYWMNYETKSMALENGKSKPNYTNLNNFRILKNL